MNQLRWFVAYTKPRREKKLRQACEQEGIAATLPCYRAVHRYRGKTVTFHKPLFPGYVFLQLAPERKQTVVQNANVARLLVVHDQELFQRQIADILQALNSDLDIYLAPQLGTGSRVRIRAGPLRGLEALVEQRYGMSTVLLRLDFIGQAAAVKMEADDLELV